MPPSAIQAIRDLLRTRKLLVRQIAPQTLRLPKPLADANITIASVGSDLRGMNGRAGLQSLLDGETNPHRLLALTSGRLKADSARLRAALEGRLWDHHRFLLRLHLNQVTALEDGLRRIDAQLAERLRPFEAITIRLRTMPGVSHVVAWTLVAETGVDMGRFPTPGHLQILGTPKKIARVSAAAQQRLHSG